MTRLALALLTVILGVSTAFAQQAPAGNGTLIVTIVDTTGAVLPGATVTVSGIEPGNKAAVIAPVEATKEGIATVAKLAPGRYSVPGSP